MNTRIITAFAAGTVLAGGLALGWGATANPMTTPEFSAAAYAQPGQAPARRGMQGRRAQVLRAMQDPAVAAIVSLRAIERVYRHEGRNEELPGLYRDVLNRTANPTVRNFANLRLARLEMRDKDAKGALDALMRNLDENLKRL